MNEGGKKASSQVRDIPQTNITPTHSLALIDINLLINGVNK